ncbi:MAG: carbohydrate kinase family protein [Candidatus Paceibacterota bacterium]
MSWNFLNFSNQDILTVGTATVDIFFKTGILPDKSEGEGKLCFSLGDKIGAVSAIFSGGGATNAAVSFARLGFKTSSFFKIGSDLFGQFVLKDLEKENVIPFPVKMEKEGTDRSLILISKNGSRVILVSRSNNPNFPKNSFSENGFRPAWAYLSPGNFPFPFLLSLTEELKKKGTKLAINPSKNLLALGSKKLKPLFQKMAVVILNREEASLLTGVPYKNEKGIFKKFDALIGGLAVMTEGQKGVMVSDGKTLWRAGIFKNKKIEDRTGAGDAFGSGFVAGLIKSKENCQKRICGQENIEFAIRLGSTNATSVVESLGAKAGLLSLKEFNSPRFKNLKVYSKKL